MTETFTKFTLGDRVTRDERGIPYHYPTGRLLEGKIVQVYGRIQKYYSPDLTLGPYPELYDVQWNSGKLSRGYLPQGLDYEEQD